MKLNLIDKVIGAVSPEAGAKRAAWRQEYEERRGNYDASDSGRLQSQWNSQNLSAEMTDRYERDAIRARARDLERNSDVMNSILKAFKRNVIGGGLQVRVTIGDSALDAEIEKTWERWCKRENCDVTGMQSFNEIVRMCIQRKITDGGVIVLKRYTSQGCLPLQLQVLEVDELDTMQLNPRNEKNRVVGGIEYNSFNRPQGYWIRQYSIDGISTIEPIYVDAKDVVFYFSKKRPSQIREMSDLSPNLTRIKDMNEFMSAVTIKEKIAACLAVFIKKFSPGGSVPGRSATAVKEGSYEGKRIVPGMIMEMSPGDEAQMLNPAGQGSDATAFIKAQQRMVSSGTGLSYEATSRDMSETNYASARQSMIEDDLTYDEERELLVESFLDEIYETFIISCYLKKIISENDFWNNKEKYFSHEWVVKPKRWIDPYKEASANAVMLKTGQKTFQQTCAENGRDWKKVLKEIKDAKETAEEMGINLMAMILGQPKTQTQIEESEGEKNEI